MTRKILSLLLLGTLSIGAQADDYNYLVITKTDGTRQSIATSGLTITFNDGQMVATAGTSTLTIAQRELSSMAFATDAADTGIGPLTADGPSLRLNGRQLYVTAPAGTRVTLFSLQGTVLCEHTQSSDAPEAVGSPLARGIYIVKLNEQATKLQVR